MIFVAATDEKTLTVFASAEDAIAYCEGIDVTDGEWLFWDQSGVALIPEFFQPNSYGRFSVGSGKYRLVSAPLQPNLARAINGLRHIDASPHFSNFTDVLTHLATTTQKPQLGA